jgi:hypothetical protein
MVFMVNSISQNPVIYTHSIPSNSNPENKLASAISDLKIDAQKPVQAKILNTPTLADFKNDENKIHNYLEMALKLDPNQKKLTEETLNELMPQVIENILRECSENASSIADEHKKNFEDMDLSKPVSPFLIKESFVKKIPKLEIAVVGANILSRGSSIVSQGMLLNKIQEVIMVRKNLLETMTDDKEKSVLSHEIDILTQWHQFHSAAFSKLLSKSVTDSIFSLPKLSAAIISLAKIGNSLVGMLIGWLGMGVSLISYAMDWKAKQNKLDMHETWKKLFEGSGRTADQIIEKQKTIYEKRLTLNLPHLNVLLQSIDDEIKAVENGTIEEKAIRLEELVIKLKDKGIEFPEKLATLEELQSTLNSSDKQSLNVMMVKKKEMLSVSLRNGLKALNQKKSQLDKATLKNEIDTSSGFFILYTYITGWTIALESLLASNILTSAIVIGCLSTALTVLSYGTLAGVVVSVLAGSIYLYMKKPNIFKTYIQGIQARLMFWNIPLSIQQFRKNCKLLEEVKIYGQINKIGLQILEADPKLREKLENKLNAKKEKWKALTEQVAELNISISRFEERIKPLQERIDQAAWKDFQLQLHGKEIELAQMDIDRPKEDLQVLVEHLLQDETLVEDDETKNLLLQMGIDLSTVVGKNRELATQELSSMIRTFFSLDVDDKIKIGIPAYN